MDPTPPVPPTQNPGTTPVDQAYQQKLGASSHGSTGCDRCPTSFSYFCSSFRSASAIASTKAINLFCP